MALAADAAAGSFLEFLPRGSEQRGVSEEIKRGRANGLGGNHDHGINRRRNTPERVRHPRGVDEGRRSGQRRPSDQQPNRRAMPAVHRIVIGRQKLLPRRHQAAQLALALLGVDEPLGVSGKRVLDRLKAQVGLNFTPNANCLTTPARSTDQRQIVVGGAGQRVIDEATARLRYSGLFPSAKCRLGRRLCVVVSTPVDRWSGAVDALRRRGRLPVDRGVQAPPEAGQSR